MIELVKQKINRYRFFLMSKLLATKYFLMIQLGFLAGLLTLFESCSPPGFYQNVVNINQEEWYVDSVAVFKFEIDDVSRTYDFYYQIRNNIDYPFYNLYLTFYLENDLGEQIDQDLQNVTLFDPKTGKPFGSGMGDLFSHRLGIPGLQQYTFPRTGTYHFKVKQYMRRDPLPGIQSLGLIIE